MCREVGLAGVGDPEVLAWATANDRIVVTHDRATMPHYAIERLAAGRRMSGLFVFNDRFPVGEAIDEILLLLECSEQEEWEGQIVYLPL